MYVRIHIYKMTRVIILVLIIADEDLQVRNPANTYLKIYSYTYVCTVLPRLSMPRLSEW